MKSARSQQQQQQQHQTSFRQLPLSSKLSNPHLSLFLKSQVSNLVFAGMHTSTAASLLAILPLLAQAAPTAQQNITVVWQHDKTSSTKSIQVMSADETQLYGQECKSTIDTGAFTKIPITFDVCDDGYGNITYGSVTYKVHSKPEYSGGISCSKRYNGNHARVDCEIPAQESYTPITLDRTESCFSGGFGSLSKHTTPAAGFSQAQKRQAPVKQHEKRMVGPPICDPVHTTYLDGDGNPHQNYYDTQLSDNINCDAASQCQVGEQNSVSYTIGFTAEATLDEWITGGFTVETTWETGNDYECVGTTGETVCIWYSTAHTAYTVTNYDDDNCEGGTTSAPFVLFSPNANNAGGASYYCVVGPCRAKGESYWDYSGPAGGPP